MTRGENFFLKVHRQKKYQENYQEQEQENHHEDNQETCREIPVKAGDILSQVLQKKQFPLATPCGGKGLCGKCRVRVEGAVSPPDAEEARFLGEELLAQGFRLACRCTLLGESTVWLERPSSEKGVKGVPGDLSAYVSEAHGREGREGAGEVSAGETLQDLYGAVFDLGTTTLGCFLYHLRRGTLEGFGFAPNPQACRGADIVTRLTLARESDKAREELQQMLLTSMKELLRGILREQNIPPEDCTELLCLGNSGMHHLFVGLPPASLLTPPFSPLFRDGLEEPPGGALAGQLLPKARLRCLPLVEGFLGGDFLGVLYSLQDRPSEKPRLVVDLGTNGEMGLLWKDRILGASAAAGPAFEGGNISCGTGARGGAVSGVRIQGSRLALETLEGLPPLGLCGSGLVDLMEVLLKGKGMDRQGRLASPGKILHPALREGLQEEGEGRSFRFGFSGEGKPLELTQQDIREFQLAKGALRGGMELLLEQAGLAWENLEEVLVAGTLGTFIRKEAALETGLFPKSVADRISSIGNAAARGGALVLLQGPEGWRDILALRDRVEHCSLESSSRFQELFLTFMSFES